MTNLQAIREDVQPYPVRQTLIERLCEKYSLSPTEAVNNEVLVTTIVIEILSQMLALNNVSEGGVSISFDKESVSMNIKRKCAEIGLDSSKFVNEPTVTLLEDWG
jgi:hypothetical protein